MRLATSGPDDWADSSGWMTRSPRLLGRGVGEENGAIGCGSVESAAGAVEVKGLADPGCGSGVGAELAGFATEAGLGLVGAGSVPGAAIVGRGDNDSTDGRAG